MPQPVIAIVGPTAAGKSGLSLQLARLLDGEIVNADSMQLYRGMDIGTAKLPPDQREGVPHHLLDIWDVTAAANVAEYQRLARRAIDAIHARGRLPIVVGGSGLYVRAVIDNLDFPGTDPELRERLEHELAEVGPAAMHAKLARLDPAAAGAILPGNGRRIVRALEVLGPSGHPFRATRPLYAAVQVGVHLPRDRLDERIAARVAGMWAAGLVAEVASLAEAGLRDGRTASRALGYAQGLHFLDGRWPQGEAAAQTVKAPRRFARRQLSWFRRDPRITWLSADEPELAGRAMATIESCGLPRATERATTS